MAVEMCALDLAHSLERYEMRWDRSSFVTLFLMKVALSLYRLGLVASYLGDGRFFSEKLFYQSSLMMD